MTEQKHSEHELTDDDLDAVAGGVNINNSHYVDPVAVNIDNSHLVSPVASLDPSAALDPLAVNINQGH